MFGDSAFRAALLLDLLVQSTLVSVRVARFFSQSVFWRVGARDAACWCVLERIGDSAGRSVSARVARFPHSPCSGVSAHVMPRVGACWSVLVNLAVGPCRCVLRGKLTICAGTCSHYTMTMRVQTSVDNTR